jgi:hypothetical protein
MPFISNFVFLIAVLICFFSGPQLLADATPQPSPALNFWRPPGGRSLKQQMTCPVCPLCRKPPPAEAAEATSLSFDEIFVMIVC